jgi:hypothetical protein
VQEEERRPLAGDQRLHPDPGDIDGFHGVPALSLRAQRRNLGAARAFVEIASSLRASQ